MGGILGVTVSSEGKVATAANFVANRVTLLDPFIIHFLTDGVYFVSAAAVKMQFFDFYCLRYRILIHINVEFYRCFVLGWRDEGATTVA